VAAKKRHATGARAAHAKRAVRAATHPRTRHLHVVRAGGGGRAVTIAPPVPVPTPGPAAPNSLTPVGLAAAEALRTRPAAPAPEATAAAPAGGGSSSNTALGLAALVGAGGAALLRARALSAGTGISDAGTLTALGHSASVFWAGSCTTLGAGSAPTQAVNVSLTSPGLATSSGLASSIGSRFGVAGVVSDTAAAPGGRVGPPAAGALVQREGDGNDNTGLVALLFAVSGLAGALVGSLAPRGRAAPEDAQ
jgi:hypothetical protein